MTDTYSTPNQGSGRYFALESDVAVLVAGARGDHAVVVADLGGAADPFTAEVQRDPEQLLERISPVLGFGDAIWRALTIASAEIVCVTDSWPPQPAQIERLTQPLIENSGLMLVSGVDTPLPLGPDPYAGDRLTELVARPLVARYEPALANLRQPMLGTFAARRSLLRTVPIPVGAGVRLSLLIDAIHGHGQDAVAEVTLERTPQGDRPLRELGADAAELIVALHRRSATTRAIADERLVQPWNDLSRITLATHERPPLECILDDHDHIRHQIEAVSSVTLSPTEVVVPGGDGSRPWLS